MANLEQLRAKLKPLRSEREIVKMLFDLVKVYENVFINLNKKQLSQGRNIFDQEIGRYSEGTLSYIDPNNPPRKPKIPGEPYNFEWTGGTIDGIYLIFDRESVKFFSKDSKAPFLEQEYGDIFGLTEKNLAEVVKRVILPAFQIQICQRLGLNT